jgi:hypothetical protein
MAMLDNSDERVQAAYRELSATLGRFVASFAKFDQSLIDQVKYVVKEHATKFKVEHGYEFPPLGLFVLPTARFIICARRDLDDKEIHNHLLVWLRQFASKGIHPSAMEVAVAVRQCWPHYRPPIEAYRRDTRKKLILH